MFVITCAVVLLPIASGIPTWLLPRAALAVTTPPAPPTFGVPLADISSVRGTAPDLERNARQTRVTFASHSRQKRGPFSCFS